MKRAICLFALALMVSTHLSLRAALREDLWRQVNDAVQKGLPKTAITNLEPIIAGALKDKAYAEAAKAIAKKIVLEGNIQGDKPEEKITRLEAEMARAPKEMAPVITGLLLAGRIGAAIAAELGSAREVVTRALNRFERDGLIRVERGRIVILDADRLARAGATQG